MARGRNFEFRIPKDSTGAEAVISLMRQLYSYLQSRSDASIRRNEDVIRRADQQIAAAHDLLERLEAKKDDRPRFGAR